MLLQATLINLMGENKQKTHEGHGSRREVSSKEGDCGEGKGTREDNNRMNSIKTLCVCV